MAYDFDKIPKWIRWTITFAFVNIAWVFFRADYFKQPFELLQRLFTGGFGLCQESMLAEACDKTLGIAWLATVLTPGLMAVVKQIWVLVYFVFWTAVCIWMPSSHEIVERKIRSRKYFVCLGILFLWSFICLSQVSKFIYFNFYRRGKRFWKLRIR